MRKILVLLLCIFLLGVFSVQAAGESPLGQKAPKPQPGWADKFGGSFIGDLADEFEAGGGLNRVVWSTKQQEEHCEAQALRFVDLSPEDRKAVAGIVIKNCEISIRRFEEENRDGKNDRDIAGGYVRLAALYEYTGPEYAANRLDALDEAIRADPYWSMGWDQKAQMLEEYGLREEAQAVRDEKDRVWSEQTRTGVGLLSLFGMGMGSLSDIPVIAALLIMLLFFAKKAQK